MDYQLKLPERLFPPPPEIPQKGITLSWIRSMFFWASCRIGDIQAILKNDPREFLEHLIRKMIWSFSQSASKLLDEMFDFINARR